MLKLNNVSYKKGLIKTLLTTAMLILAYLYIEARYHFVYDGQEGEKSTEYSVFIVDSWNKTVGKDDHVAFHTEKMQPFFPLGTMIVKQVKGIPGDQVTITDTLVINDQELGQLNLLPRLDKTALDYARKEVIPENELFVYGVSPRSYDSRYWGNLDKKGIIGKAYGIF